MFMLGVFATVVVAGFALAKLRSRGNDKPNVTRLNVR